MKRRASQTSATELPPEIVVCELEEFLRESRIRRVHFSDGSTVPPALAQVANFPRLSIPLTGHHAMEIANGGLTKTIKPTRGHVVFVPEHAWNKPDWSGHVEVLNFLFGVKQIELNLVRHRGGSQLPSTAIKTSVYGGYDVPTRGILAALMDLAPAHSDGTLARLLIESLLHACLRLLKSPRRPQPRKAIRTYESICLYLQENFRNPITRESVASHFRLAPNHVSRLFRQEGLVRFNDYLNLVRVNRAKFMLQKYGMTLKEIADNCGYSDATYFCKVFKKICRVTPTEYRARSSSGGLRSRISRIPLAGEFQMLSPSNSKREEA